MAKPIWHCPAATPTVPHAHTAACENCHTALQGAFCHQCGQAAHNPLKSFTHAMEDVFESFWHLDGRIFNTLRERRIPGRVAMNYLVGQRVRYLPPLRLFVILSLFVFLMVRLSLSTDGGIITVTTANDQFTSLAPPAEVLQQRDTLLAGLPVADDADFTTRTAVTAARLAVNEAATARIDMLEGRGPTLSTDPRLDLRLGNNRDGAWHPVDNPVALAALPQWANAAINQWLEPLQAKLRPGQGQWQYLAGKFIAALPAALIVMLLLALVLRLVYFRRPMGYLEHLLGALYSHVWLLSVLFVTSAFNTLAALSGIALLDTLSALVSSVLWLSVPVYLWCMQRRIYGGSLLAHAARFGVTAATYGVFVLLATLYAMAASLTS